MTMMIMMIMMIMTIQECWSWHQKADNDDGHHNDDDDDHEDQDDNTRVLASAGKSKLSCISTTGQGQQRRYVLDGFEIFKLLIFNI